MTQNILTAGNATSSQSIAAGDDGTFKIVVGPNGSQVDGLAIGATGNAAVAGTLTQAGIATPRMVLATAQNTTSGTSIDFTSIPSWVKRITVMLVGVSTNGTSQLMFQIGAGSITAGGYFSEGEGLSASANRVQFSTGFGISENNAAAYAYYGSAVLTNAGSNTWTMTGMFAIPGTKTALGSGSLQLGGTLDRIRLTTVNGTDTFDAGSVNILYEG